MSGQKDRQKDRQKDKQKYELEGLLHHPELWRAGQLERAPEAASTGFRVLDEHLPGGGWPRGALAELLIASAGVGELRLLVPHIRALSRSEDRWIAWIDPPFVPYAPALKALGVDIRKILLIHPRSHQQALWALERASRSGTCSMALAWLDERQIQQKDTRRLQLAARQGRTSSFLFRPEAAGAMNSMAELRLTVTPTGTDGITVGIRKRRGGWPVEGIHLLIDDAPAPAEIHEQLSLWRTVRRRAREETAGENGHHPPGGFPLERPGAGPRVTH